MMDAVTYLGHKIDAQGLHPVMHKVDAVRKAPKLRNVSKLKSYLGLLSYYGKFLPNLSTTMAPPYQLLKTSSSWLWSLKQDNAFEELKKTIDFITAINPF